VPGPRRRPGRHQRAQLRGTPEHGPRSGRASREPRATRPAARLGQSRPQQRPRPHAQFLEQPGRHLPPRDQRTGPVPSRGELPHQIGVRRLVQRVQLAAQPRPPRRRSGVAVTLGGRGVGFQRLGQLRPQLPPRRLGPVVGISGQQLAVTQRTRGRHIASSGTAPPAGQIYRDGFGAQPDRGPRRDQHVVAGRLAQRPHSGAQVRPRGRPGGARPQQRRHGLAVVRSRAQG